MQRTDPPKFWGDDKKTPAWKSVSGPSAGLVQQHFVESRQEALYRRNKDLEKLVKQALTTHKSLASLKLSGDKWLPVYEKINRNLQAADLTINFNAASWFAQENKYETYAQAYERSGRDAQGIATLKGDRLNPAIVRADVDDRVTFPRPVAGAATPMPQRGLTPGRQGQARVEAYMKFDPKLANADGTPLDRLKAPVAHSQNRHFDAKTRQVFAALNYGRRPHGSSYEYGGSHMVLNDKFKVNALYFGGDTFYIKDAAAKQTAYHTLGALVAWADDALLTDIIRSCYAGTRLPDTKDFRLLLEGHIFAEVAFSGGISTIFLDAPAQSVYHVNAKTFAAKHGARLVLVDPVS